MTIFNLKSRGAPIDALDSEPTGSMMSDSSQQLQLANEIKLRARPPRLGSEFDAFLFSPIGDDRNGMALNVVSILARRDLDPWQEAASLAGMPVDVAIRRLQTIIRALPEQTLTLPDSATVAQRLIALLPHRTDPEIRRPEKLAKAPAKVALTVSRRNTVVAMIAVISILLLVGARLATLHNEPPAQAVGADAQPVPVAPSQTPPPTEK